VQISTGLRLVRVVLIGNLGRSVKCNLLFSGGNKTREEIEYSISEHVDLLIDNVIGDLVASPGKSRQRELSLEFRAATFTLFCI
jgi:hypothetical protein